MADRHDGLIASERSPLLSFPSPESVRPSSRRSDFVASLYSGGSIRGTVDDDGDDANANTTTATTSELRLLASYSLPLIATYLLQYSFFVITTIVAGHLGPDDLAAESIGVMTMNVVGLAIFEGMATALDTLCAQAYGSGNLVGVGLHVQRMLLLMGVACVPIGVVWATSPYFLPLFLKQPHLAVKAGVFLRYSLVGLPGYAAFEAVKRFLQAQGNCNVGMVVLIVCAPVNAVLSWLFAFPLGMGLAGAALGTALSNNLRFVLLLLYIVSPLGTWSHGCWGGFSREALGRWGPMLSLSVAGAVATLAEWGSFEILIFSTSFLGTEHLAAQTVLTVATVIVWHIPFSISVAVSTRLGHLIGGGLLPTARRAARLYMAVFLAVGIFDAAVFFVLRHQIPVIFSNDPLTREIAARSFLTVALFQVTDSLLSGTNGLMRGLGRQDVAAVIVTVLNYAGSVPLAIWLELGPLRWELDGLWIGFAVGSVGTIVAEGVYMKWLDWQRCVDRVKEREEDL